MQTESVLNHRRAGLSYTVASIGFVKPKPTAFSPKGANAPVTPYRKDNQMRERNIIINIRVTDKEKKALERSAKRTGLSLSAFIRKSGLNQKIYAAPSDTLHKAYDAVEWLLKRLSDFSKSEIEVNLINIRERILDAYYEKEDSDGDNKDMGD